MTSLLAMEKNRQPIKLESNIKKIADLKLVDAKVDLMKDSVFGSLSSVSHKRESSATLVEVLSTYYNTSTKCFELPNEIRFSFCAKEVADVIGMKDDGVDVKANENKCSRATFPPTALSKAKAAVLKATLTNMPIDNEEGQRSFKELMCYFLVEQVLLCARDGKKLRSKYWSLVADDELRERCNWAQATLDHLHTSLDSLKTWRANKSSEQQHSFTGAAPVLETIMYERIEKLRPEVHKIDTPLIQKYSSRRLSVTDWEVKFNQLKPDDIADCRYCTCMSESEETVASSTEITPVVSKNKASIVQDFQQLSITPMSYCNWEMHQDEVTPMSDLNWEMHQDVPASADVATNEEQMKELEGVCTPIIAKMHQGGAPATDVSEEAVSEVDPAQHLAEEGAAKKAVEDEASVSVADDAETEKYFYRSKAGRIVKPSNRFSPSDQQQKKKKQARRKKK